MKLRQVFATFAVLSLAACTSPAEEEPRRRTTGSTVTDPNTPGGATDSPTAVVVELAAAASSANVGETVALTASVWLGTDKTTPVTDGTVVDFEVAAGTAGVLRASQAAATGGKATVQLEGREVGNVEVRARSLTAISSNVTVGFNSVGVAPTVVPKTVEITPVSSNYVRVEDPASTADEAYFTITVISSAGAYMAGVTVDVTANDGTVTPSRVITNASGSATVKYTAGIVASTITLKAEVKRWGATTLSDVVGTSFIDVEAGAPIIIVAAPPTAAQIGVRGSGTLDSSMVAYEIFDKYGNPASDNTLVNFTVQPPIAGASISPASSTTYGGRVYAVVNSGTQAGTLRVVATVPAAGRSVASGNIQIFGGRPSASSFNLAIEPTGLVMSGLVLNLLPADLVVTATDRYGNPPPPGTQVIVFCEAGICGTNDGFGSGLGENGAVTIPYYTSFANKIAQSGVTAPVQFPVLNGNMHRWPALGVPGNGFVTIMAMTVGESAFDDLDGNGLFDLGIDVVTNDPPEPWLDRNENGAFDAGESFWDFDGDGAWTNHAPSAYRSEQYIWDDITISYVSDPAPQVLPVQFMDMDSDGYFDPYEDVGVTGVIDTLDWALFPAGATLTTLKGYYNPNYLETWGYIGDRNQNGLPVKTRAEMNFGSVACGGCVGSSMEFGVGGTATFLRAQLDDEFPGSSFSICAQVTVLDTDTTFKQCINAYTF